MRPRSGIQIGGVLILCATIASPTLLFVADPSTNDFYAAASTHGKLSTKAFESVSDAVAAAARHDGLLVMADALLPSDPGLPQHGVTNITADEWAVITAKQLFVYIEFPSSMPGNNQ